MGSALSAAGANLLIYFAGGATAVLHGWRGTTIDVDIAIEGDVDGVLRAIPGLKEELQVNFPAIDPKTFRRAVEEGLGGRSGNRTGTPAGDPPGHGG